jgi:hypothetical protein
LPDPPAKSVAFFAFFRFTHLVTKGALS